MIFVIFRANSGSRRFSGFSDQDPDLEDFLATEKAPRKGRPFCYS